MKKAKKGHAVKQLAKLKIEQERAERDAAARKRDAEDKKLAKLERMQTDPKYMRAQILKTTTKSGAKPHCIVGWVLDIAQADGTTKRGTVVAMIKPRLGSSTKHLIHYEDGTEDAIELARKDGHAGMLEKQRFNLIRPQEDLPTKRGYLIKRAIVSQRNWKKRFFVLDGRSKSLRYYRTEPHNSTRRSMEPSKGVFNLAARCTVKVFFDECEDNPDGRSFCFEITSTETGRSLVLSAPNAGVMRDWVSHVQQTIEWKPGVERQRRKDAELRKAEADCGISELQPDERQACVLATKATKALMESLAAGESDGMVDLVMDLVKECVGLKPKLVALIEELFRERPAFAGAVIAINEKLDQAIDNGYAVLQSKGRVPDHTPGAAMDDSEEDDDDSGGSDDDWSDDDLTSVAHSDRSRVT
eukprot:g384.t1